MTRGTVRARARTRSAPAFGRLGLPPESVEQLALLEPMMLIAGDTAELVGGV